MSGMSSHSNAAIQSQQHSVPSPTASPSPDPFSRLGSRWTTIAALLIIGLGVTVMIGWVFEIETLKSVIPGMATMKLNTARCFFLVGVSLLLLAPQTPSPRRRKAALLPISIVMLIAGLTLLEYIFGVDLSIDQFILRDTAAPTALLTPGRMAPITAISMLLLGFSLMTLSWKRWPFFTQSLAIIVLAIALLALLGYLYGVTSLYGVFAFSSVALHTAVGLMLATTAVLAARPNEGLIAVLTRDTIGGSIARRFLPAIILVPVVLGWLRLKGQQAGLYGTEFGLALYASANVFTFALLVWLNAHLLNQSDRERRGAAAQVYTLNRLLTLMSYTNQTIVRIRDLPTVFHTICHVAIERGGFQVAWIALVDHATGVFTPAAQSEADTLLDPDHRIGPALFADASLLAQLRTGKPILATALREDSRVIPWRDDLLHLGVDGLGLFPLLVDGGLRGVLCLGVSDKTLFEDEEIQLLNEMAGDVAFAMAFSEQERQRVKIEAALQRYAQRMEILHEIDTGILESRSVDEIIETVLRRIRLLIPAKRTTVSLFDDSMTETTLFVTSSDAPSNFKGGSKIPLVPNLVSHFNDQNIMWSDNILEIPGIDDATRQRLMEDGVVSLMSVLLMDHNTPKGTFSLFATTPGFFTAEYREIAVEVGHQIAIAIRQLFLTRELHKRNLELERTVEAIKEGEAAVRRYAGTLEATQQFLQATLDAFPANVAVLASDGTIVNVNSPWKRFADVNNAPPDYSYIGMNYLDVCHAVTGPDREVAMQTANGIQRVINGQQENFYLEYYCPTPTMTHWFEMQVTAFADQAPRRVVIAHIDITQRRIIETALQKSHETLERRVSERTAELQATKERVEAILNNSLDGMVLMRANLTIQQTNAAFNEMFRVGFDEYLNQSLFTLIADEYRDLTDALVQRAMGERTGTHIEVRARRKDDTFFDAELSIGFTNRGGVVCTVRDITERKAQERQMRYHASLQANVSDAVIATDLNFRIQSWNKAAEEIYGWRASEVMGKSVNEVLRTQYGSEEQRNAIMQAFLANGHARGEYIQLHKNGTSVRILGSTDLFRDATGVPFGVVSINHDITTRKQVEEELQQSEEKFRLLVDAAPVATVITDERGKITLINGRAETLFGYSRDEIIGQPVEILLPTHLVEQHKQHRDQYMHAPHMRQMGLGLELFARRKDESLFPVEIQLSYIQTWGGLLVMSFILDITERKQAEQALRQALQAEKELGELKSRFVSMASHEFRNPLGSILALTETLTAYRSRLTDEQIEMRLHKIKEQVDHLKDIMEDVLQLARLQARRVTFTPVLTDLDALCRSVMDEFESQPNNNHTFDYFCDPSLKNVRLDKRVIRQVLSNLVANAIKYSAPESTIRIRLERDDDVMVLKVADEGIGIPETDLKHLFEPFHRASNVETIPGTGLGLVIVKESVELHSGLISVETQVDVGTTFIIRIPIT